MNGGTMYEQGEIVLIPFPYSDLTGIKKRPALIVSNKKLNNSDDRLCCLITSNKPKEGILINSFQKGKLPFQSWVKPHRLFEVNKKIIAKPLCRVTKGFHKKVLAEIMGYIK